MMRREDMAEVMAVERAAYSSGWPATAFERELTQNAMARYLVLRKPREDAIETVACHFSGGHAKRDAAAGAGPRAKVRAQFCRGVLQHWIARVIREAAGRNLFEGNGHAQIVRPLPSGGL